MQMIFQTARLILRQITLKDAPLILKLNSDADIVKYVHEPVLKNEQQAQEIITTIILPQYKKNLGRWAIINKEDESFMGWCGLKQLDETNEIDLGFRLMKQYQGKGFATEAAMHTLDYGFNHLKIPLITAKVHTQNLASINVIEKIGMQFIGEGMVDGNPVKTYTKANSILKV